MKKEALGYEKQWKDKKHEYQFLESVIENMLRHNMADELIMTIAECIQEVIDEARKRLACSTN